MSLELGRDYRVLYSCKVGTDGGLSCGFNTFTFEDLEKHFLANHPTSQQIAKIFGFLAKEGLNVDDVLKLLSEGHDLAKYALVTQTKISTLENTLTECQGKLQKAVEIEREACAKIADEAIVKWDTRATLAHKDAAGIIAHLIRNREVKTDE